MIEESEYNEEKHLKLTEEEKKADRIRATMNIKDICKSRSAPGMFLKTDDSRGSVMHNHKLDAGAAADLIDKGLDGAKKRVLKRKKKYGSGYRKMKTGKLIPRKRK